MEGTPFEPVKSTPISRADAEVYIRHTEHLERQRGRFDSEGDAFAALRRSLEAEDITPEEAVRRADALSSERQDYN